MRAIVLVVALAAVLSLGCGRANPRLIEIVRTEGDQVTTTELQYDSSGRVLNVERLIGEEPSVDGTEYTWTDNVLTEITRTRTFDDFFNVTTTVLEYEQDRVTKATAIEQILAPEQEPRDVSEETFVVEYDVALMEALTRTFADDDGNSSSTVTTLTYDKGALVEVSTDSSFKNNGAPDEESSTVTTIGYAAGRPTDLSIVQDEGRATTQSITYKKGAIENAVLTIPALDDFGNELFLEGLVDYRYDSEGRLSRVIISADGRNDIEIELGYTDGEASSLDLVPAEVGALPLWDLRGASYDLVDARTQGPRLVGASW